MLDFLSFNLGILQEVEDLAQKVLLPVQEVKWHLDHYQMILKKRKGVQKASKKKTQENDSLGRPPLTLTLRTLFIGKE